MPRGKTDAVYVFVQKKLGGTLVFAFRGWHSIRPTFGVSLCKTGRELSRLHTAVASSILDCTRHTCLFCCLRQFMYLFLNVPRVTNTCVEVPVSAIASSIWSVFTSCSDRTKISPSREAGRNYLVHVHLSSAHYYTPAILQADCPGGCTELNFKHQILDVK